MKISFHGAAHEVTGSCYLVEVGAIRFLVDCGMFQGGPEADRKNLAFPHFDAEGIAFVLLTHAHIDHSGLLPRLSVLGFRGPVYCTAATADLLEVMLPDSAHIQEKEAEWQNYATRKKQGRFTREIAPLYTVIQAQRCLRQLRTVEYDAPIQPHPDVRVVYRDAGHILGSAILEVWVQDGAQQKKIVFSGDLGMPRRPLMRDPTPIEEADFLLVESTYGNRLHKSLDATIHELAEVVDGVIRHRRGNVVIPAFAVGRTQEILYLLTDLRRQGRIPAETQIVVDSPMAAAATRITMKYHELLDPESQALLIWERHQQGPAHIRFTETVEDSMALNHVAHGLVIISASGMCNGGRIKQHLKYNLPRRESAVLIAGFQAQGTLGRKLVDGAKSVRIFQQQVPVLASLHTLGGLSAHADQRALIDWLQHFKKPPRQTFVVHGEAETAQGFGALLQQTLGWPVAVPSVGTVVDC